MPLIKKISQFPTEPGVYLMKDEEGKIIYVGKAVNLKNRVKSYFLKEAQNRYQIEFLMKRVIDIDYLVTKTEKEALLLENSLIKKHRPRYNIHLRDDKNYVSLRLSLEDDFPKLSLTRKIKKDGALYFGPYSSADACRQTVEFIYRNFKLRTCSDHEFNNRTRPCLEYQIGRCLAPCVGYVSQEEYAIQAKAVRFLLEGKNQELISSLKAHMQQKSSEERFEEAAIMRDLLNHINVTLEKQNVIRHVGLHQDLVVLYREGGRGLVAVLNIRDGSLLDSSYYPIRSMEPDDELMQNFLGQYYLSNDFIPDEILVYPETQANAAFLEILAEKKGKNVPVRFPKKGEKKDLIELALKNALAQFTRLIKKEYDHQEILKTFQTVLGLSEYPHRIECYDVSNIQGEEATASRVVFVDGESDKNQYRRYKIRFVEGPNDYAMLYETLQRRFHGKSKKDYPQLLIVDGGKGQLAIALEVLRSQGLESIPVIGIAKGSGQGARAKGLWKEKKEEEIYLPNRKNPLILKRGSPELMLLQRIRDESHRFALKYHQYLRDQKIKTSFLDGIEGLGPMKKKALYKAFKNEEGLYDASVEDLMRVSGINQKMAEKIKNYCNWSAGSGLL